MSSMYNREDVMECNSFREIEILGRKGLWSDGRFTPANLPEGLFFYEIRHTDEDDMIPAEIAKWICVNYWGCFITNEPIEFPNGKSLVLTEEERENWSFLEKDYVSVNAYFSNVLLPIGTEIKIESMDGEPQYSGKTGKVTHIDDIGQIFGSWGGVALLLTDKYKILSEV